MDMPMDFDTMSVQAHRPVGPSFSGHNEVLDLACFLISRMRHMLG